MAAPQKKPSSPDLATSMPAGLGQLHSKGAGGCRGFIHSEFCRLGSAKQDVDRNDEPSELMLKERLKYGSENAS